ncbi:multicopper oxidase family protein [Saccharospirillum impatiens]|jgi:FtsP/CotA-like multicopper oxidase with cupredoxin domain|uniref:multicopper oxidase family protein n=1 Tax=Saccharospirillum impatiens TaxID=169438 RepID=UPI000414044C|nr:multicopper oxidase domain-containing protein [Saccharospirillum impatiens]
MRDFIQPRRNFLKSAGSVATFALLPSAVLLSGCQEDTTKTTPEESGLDDGPFDVELTLFARPDVAAILSGSASEVWRYTAKLIKGPADTLTHSDDSYIGPLIRLRRGQRVRVHIENHLTEATTVHWHGLHVPPEVDGQPRFPIQPDATRTVSFLVDDRAGLYWYHPHPHGDDGGRVGFQSYAGLAGPLIIEDNHERELDLPKDNQELVIVLQDRNFTGENELKYLSDGMGSMMTRMQGFKGDHLLVNGKPAEVKTALATTYRLRILNGSNARIYKLAWSDGRPVTVIGTDGGLLESPEEHAYVALAPAQRIDLWVSFEGDPEGTEIQLINEPHRAGDMMDGGMMGNLMGGSDNTSDKPTPLLTMAVSGATERAVPPLPGRLSSDLDRLSQPGNTANIRQFRLSMKMMRGFAINDRQFEGVTVADDEVVSLGATEVWEFFNDTTMPHPMHVHGLQFRVVSRKNADARSARQLMAGIVDSGLHDTVLVLPGERVRIAMTFKDFEGLYLYHCHNMEHEDNGMMRYYEVRK